MILMDLVIVGVGRFAQPTRFSFHKGYTVVYGLNETGKSTFARAMMAVFFPEIYSRIPDFINWQLSGTSRAYVTLKEGNEVYRLTRDFSQKLSNLARYIPDKKVFALVSKDDKEISDFLAEKLGLFDEEIYSNVFLSDFLHLPSTNPYGVIGLIPKPAPSASPSGAGSSSEGADGAEEDTDTLKERLEVLKNEMTRGKELDTLQADLDDLNGKLYEIQSRTKEVREIEAKLAEINSFFDRSKSLGDIAGIKSRTDRYLESEKRKDAQINEIKSRRGQAEAELANSVVPSLKDNKYLVPGAGIAIGAIVLLLFKENILSFLPEYTKEISIAFTIIKLGIMAGLGLVAWGIWQFLNAQNQIQALRSTLNEADTDIRQIQGKFESETKDFREIMRTLGTSNVEELKAKLMGIEQMEGKKKTFDERHQQLVKEHNYQGLIDEEKALKKRIEEVEAKLESMGALGYTQQEMKEEIKRIESMLIKRGVTVTRFDDAKAEAKGFGRAAKPSRFPDDHFSRLIAIATELVQKGQMEPLGELQKNFDKNIQILSNNNYARSSISKDGIIKFLRGDNLMRVGLDSMSPAAKDSMYFSLKFALVSSIIKKKVLPIILDDPFILFDDKRLQTILSIVKELSATTQVIHLTSKQAAVKGADLSFQIK